MRNYLIGILMPVLTLFFFSCKKSPADGGPYTFHNKMREPVNLSLYKTQDDYMYSRNALLSIRIPAQSNYTWRYTGGDGVFDKDALLYLDWHTDDYTHTNWYIFDSAKNVASYKEAPLFKFTRRRFGLNEETYHTCCNWGMKLRRVMSYTFLKEVVERNPYQSLSRLLPHQAGSYPENFTMLGAM